MELSASSNSEIPLSITSWTLIRHHHKPSFPPPQRLSAPLNDSFNYPAYTSVLISILIVTRFPIRLSILIATRLPIRLSILIATRLPIRLSILIATRLPISSSAVSQAHSTRITSTTSSLKPYPVSSSLP
ncbi:hypothetical protein AVEN_28703-1 [Araneus ventricosus]|uniref:Uncharacterized protein n=1 Tax=Araneus ventricosus TaxID=182803 RepID=A0A4Y2J3Q0_ARAVE|nr:hypothetical protein AVEN_28703-1 [Araneus ventricosus]